MILRAALGCIFLIMICTGCPAPVERRSSEPLEVELSGCLSVRPGPVCELTESRELRVWLRGTALPAPSIESGGRKLTSTSSETGGGVLYTLTAGENDRELTISRSGWKSWRVDLMPTQKISAIEEAQRLQKNGDAAGADRVLAEMLPALAANERARVIRERARLARARGDPVAFVLYREAMDALTAEQRFCEAADYALAIAFTATRLGRRFELAREALEQHAAMIARAAICADPAARAPYYSGVLAMETGDLVNAVSAFEEAEARTARIGLSADEAYAAQGRALALEQLGRNEEAWRLLEARAPREKLLAACDRALGLGDRGWVAWMLRESRELEGGAAPSLAEVRALFEEAHALYGAGEGRCDLAEDRANVEINLALVSLAEGKVEDAGRWIRSARAALPNTDPPLELWIGDVQGRVALAAGRFAEAERIYVQLAELAGELASDEAQWRAAIGRAAALERLGRTENAITAYRSAEAILDRESSVLPLGRGRETFLSTRDRGTQRFVELLEKSGQEAEALRVARTARVRVLALVSKTGRLAQLSAEARATWDQAIAEYRQRRDELDQLVAKRWMASKRSLSTWEAEHAEVRRAVDVALRRALAVVSSGAPNAKLRAVAADELLLFYQASPAGWLGFAAESGGVSAKRLQAVALDVSPEVLAARLLAPFAQELSRARRVRLMPQGALKAVDLHVLPWEGAPLFAQKQVAYAVDRPGAVPVNTAIEPQSVLIVADPNNDLSSARREGSELAASRFQGTKVTLLDGAAASGAAVRSALSENVLFHFAGHAMFGGIAGWDSALLLAGGDRLGIGDILALPKAPRWAVLMACESGRVSNRTGVDTLGLAHAFLAAGSEEVIAAARPLEDRAARALSRAIHANFAELKNSADGWVLAESLRRAQREAKEPDAAALRAFVP